jgi:hypothetical protein
MEIKIDKFTLASHGVESVNDYTLQGTRQKEIRPKFRGDYPGIFDRGNAMVQITFTMEKEFPDYVAAFEWLHDLESKLPRSGVAVITETDGRRSSVRRFNLSQVRAFGGKLIGCTVSHNYELIGTELIKPNQPST